MDFKTVFYNFIFLKINKNTIWKWNWDVERSSFNTEMILKAQRRVFDPSCETKLINVSLNMSSSSSCWMTLLRHLVETFVQSRLCVAVYIRATWWCWCSTQQAKQAPALRHLQDPHSTAAAAV